MGKPIFFSVRPESASLFWHVHLPADIFVLTITEIQALFLNQEGNVTRQGPGAISAHTFVHEVLKAVLYDSGGSGQPGKPRKFLKRNFATKQQNNL